jgi:hypothetical protein
LRTGGSTREGDGQKTELETRKFKKAHRAELDPVSQRVHGVLVEGNFAVHVRHVVEEQVEGLGIGVKAGREVEVRTVYLQGTENGQKHQDSPDIACSFQFLGSNL